MAKVSSIEVALEVKYKIVFFPFATFTRVGEIELLTVLGVRVWQKAGDVCALFGVAWAQSKV